jgi:hypothetical protein
MVGSPFEGDEKQAQGNILRTETEQRAYFSRVCPERPGGFVGID